MSNNVEAKIDELIRLVSNKSKLSHHFEEIDKEYNALENKNKNLENDLKRTEQEKQEEKQRFEEQKQELENKNKNLENDLKRTEQEKQEEKQRFEEQKQELENKNKNLENDLKRTEQELEEIKKDAFVELYELYQELPSEFTDKSSIDKKSLFSFIATAGSRMALANLHEVLQHKLAVGDSNSGKFIKFFNKLFEIQKKYGDQLDSFGSKPGEKFDDEKHISANKIKQGKISEVLVDGYANGAKKYKSIVEVIGS